MIELWEKRGERMNRLTVAGARALKEPGMYRADPTLYLNVAAGGSKSWIQRIAIHGKRRDIGLGGFPLGGRLGAGLSLAAEARAAPVGHVAHQDPADDGNS